MNACRVIAALLLTGFIAAGGCAIYRNDAIFDASVERADVDHADLHLQTRPGSLVCWPFSIFHRTT